MFIAQFASKQFSVWKRFLNWSGSHPRADASLHESLHEQGDRLTYDSAPNLSATVDLEKMIDHVLVYRMQFALELAHSAKAKYLYAVPVHERKNGTTIWYGRVYLFALEQQGLTKQIYAWYEDVTGGPTLFHSVFREGPVDSPDSAVRVALGLKT